MLLIQGKRQLPKIHSQHKETDNDLKNIPGLVNIERADDNESMPATEDTFLASNEQ